MSDCPMCGSADYNWHDGCRECAYYDEDGHREWERDKKRHDRRMRNGRKW